MGQVKSNLLPGMDNPGGSMFGPEDLENKLLEQVTMTRGQLAEYLHEGIMELNPKMQEQFDALEQQVTALEAENAELRVKVRNVGS